VVVFFTVMPGQGRQYFIAGKTPGTFETFGTYPLALAAHPHSHTARPMYAGLLIQDKHK